MNSNELLDQMVNVLADAVWLKIKQRLDEEKKIAPANDERDFYNKVMAVIDDIDFDERIDTHSIVQDVLAEIDVESTVREELRNTTFTVSVD